MSVLVVFLYSGYFEMMCFEMNSQRVRVATSANVRIRKRGMNTGCFSLISMLVVFLRYVCFRLCI